MQMRRFWLDRAVCAAVVCVSLVSAASAVNIETVPVGNPGNAAERAKVVLRGCSEPDRACNGSNLIKKERSRS